ncbi:2-hydroxychromene-2-carboxylate isomerase [Pollutimonas sp. H1-120]|uniref:2-hydroxychromene-2-carboxylate isomerase n=1 Tax=Pollutimonas sp. H1-120 TaxID=3148824 RepID=UPI003B5195D1
MTKNFDFYFDFSSPYGYLASTQIEALAAEFGRQVNWHPILLGPLFKTMGSAPLTDIPLKGKYALHDFERSARLFGIPYSQPKDFPIGTVAAARAVLYLQRSAPEKAVDFIKRLYRAYFVEGRNIGESETMLALAAEEGIDTAELANGIAQEETKNLLKKAVSDAMERGVFGSPFVFADGEPFWGFDRFDHIRKWLRNRS